MPEHKFHPIGGAQWKTGIIPETGIGCPDVAGQERQGLALRVEL
jgi:hypothetical protein